MKNVQAALVPIFFLFVTLIFNHQVFLPYKYVDPDLGYLMNSLLIADGNPVHHVDHPGTILQILGSLVIIAVRFFYSIESNFLTVAEHHALIIFLISWLSIAIFIACQFVTGRILLSLGYYPWVVWLVLLSPLCIQEFPTRYFRASPEAIFAACGGMVAAIYMQIIRSKSHQISVSKIATLGFLIGLTISVKFNALPILLFCLVPFAISHSKNRLGGSILALLFAITAFALATIPAWPRFQYFYEWILGIWRHSSNYGLGEAKVTSLSQFKNNILFLLNNNGSASQTITVVGSFFLLLIPIWKRKWIYLLPILVFVATLFLIIKHPASRYLLALTPMIYIALLQLQRIPQGISLVICFVWITIFSLNFFIELKTNYKSNISSNFVIDRFDSLLNQQEGECAIVATTLIPIKQFAFYSGQIAGRDIQVGLELENMFSRYSFWFGLKLAPHRYNLVYRFKKWEEYLNKFPCQVFVGSQYFVFWISEAFEQGTNLYQIASNDFNGYSFLKHQGRIRLQKSIWESSGL